VDICGRFWDVLDVCGGFWDVLDVCGSLWDVLDVYGRFWDVSGRQVTAAVAGGAIPSARAAAQCCQF